LMTGPVWPPECVWPDYTKPEVRDWWGPLYKELYNQQGISGFWNDMNEPAVFKVHQMTFPEDVRHDYEGHGADHAKTHNIYGMQMSRATYDGLKALQPQKRPFLLCRASFSGGQRFAALWTGDNVASWEHLRLANSQCLRLSISGYSFVGTDIGGFVDEPTGELMVRWLQLAAFHPVMRVHSMGNNSDGAAEAEAEAVKKAERNNRQDQEPWVYGEPYTSHARAAIDLRYRLLPYLYSAFQQHLENGRPLLRNLFFLDQKDPNCRKYGDQFLVGDDLLVCPVMKPKARSMTVYLPKGEWYDYWTNNFQQGGQKIKLRLKADQIPIFVPGGSVLPQVDTTPQSTAELLQAKQLRMDVYYAKTGQSQLYLDQGEGYDYLENGSLQQSYSWTADAKGLRLDCKSTGAFQPKFQQIEWHFHGLPKAVKQVKIGRKSLDFSQSDDQVVVQTAFELRKMTLEY
ncbi:MAG: TIM-barrel domain-containing protein, partial [Bacteroidota bacterium]